MKHLALVLLFLLACVITQSAHAAPVVIQCTPPIKNDDESPLTNLVGYRIYASPVQTASGTMTQVAADPACRYTLDLQPGTWFIRMRSYTASAESELTVAAQTTVVGPQCGPAPPTESQQQICTAPLIGNWQQTRTYVSAPAPQCWIPGPWVPTEAAAGVCASPPTPSLVTTDTAAYELRGTAFVPTMNLVGLVPLAAPCGPDTQVVKGVKYCRIQIWKAGVPQVLLTVFPVDFKVTGVWAKTAP